MQWLMLQQDEPKDYVIATGEQHSVREFVDLAASFLDMDPTWEGEGAEERGKDKRRMKLLPLIRATTDLRKSILFWGTRQGKTGIGLAAADHFQRAGEGNGGRRSESSRAGCAGTEARVLCFQLPRALRSRSRAKWRSTAAYLLQAIVVWWICNSPGIRGAGIFEPVAPHPCGAGSYRPQRSGGFFQPGEARVCVSSRGEGGGYSGE